VGIRLAKRLAREFFSGLARGNGETEPALRLQAVGKSHIGNVRQRNEDRLLVRHDADDAWLLVVSDGMGGASSGDYAAQRSVDFLADYHPAAQDICQELAYRVRQASDSLRSEARADAGRAGMGATLTAVYVAGDQACWAHVGDSRLYMLRDGQLEQVTKDHTLVQSLQDQGVITRQEALLHPYRNVLEQCVGCPACLPATGRLTLRPGDLLLLSTDGLHGALSLENTLDDLDSDAPPEAKAETLVKAALDAGGRDNITVVLGQAVWT